MVSMTFIWWIYHFWARFWPYFNFVDFRAYFGPFSLVNRDRQKMADLLMKMASNQKMQENKPTLKFNFTIEKRWPVSKFSFWHSHWALFPTIIQIWSRLFRIVEQFRSLGWTWQINTNAPNAKNRWVIKVNWRDICSPTVEKRCTFVQNVRSHLAKQVIWRGTC